MRQSEKFNLMWNGTYFWTDTGAGGTYDGMRCLQNNTTQMVPSVRLRETIILSTRRGSTLMWRCQLSSIFRIFLCVGMVPMIFPESEALRTNLSLFGTGAGAGTTTITDAMSYYDYTTTSTSLCIVSSQQRLQVRDSLVHCPALMMRPRSIGSLIDAANSIGRITQRKTQRCYRKRYYVNDPVLALISWIVAVASSSCILLWARFYRWKFTILIGLVTLQITSSTTWSSNLLEGLSILFRMFGSWYMRNLHANPIITKSISAGLIGTVADYGAQWLEHILHHQKQQQPLMLQLTTATTTKIVASSGTSPEHDTTKTSPPSRYTLSISIYGRYDIRRGISTLMDGLFISGPLMHIGYDLFELILPINSSHTGWIAAMLHVIADSILLDSFFVASKFFTTGLMEGITARDLRQQFYATYIPSLQASWITSILLCPIQLSCFCYLPLRFRVLSVNIIDVVWDAVLSFMTHRSR